MADKDVLRSMLNNLINDRSEEATLDIHNYLNSKMKVTAGITAAPTAEADEPENDED